LRGALALALALASAQCAPQRSGVAESPPTATNPASALSSIDSPHVYPPFEDGRVPFTLHFQGIETSLGIMSAFVLPGSTLEIRASGGSGTFVATAGNGGTLASAGTSVWNWTAPQAHGDHVIRIRDSRGADDEVATLHVFVLHPYDGGEKIGHYKVGRYQAKPKDDNPAYNRPEGFVEVTDANIDMMVSPHFRLRQFLCKDDVGTPKYVILRSALLIKLEMLLQALAKRGVPATSLHVMSGYRTPAHNGRIGSRTKYSRHTYGDAADVFLDRDGDGMQDDLNHDGLSTREDARILSELVESTLDESLPGAMAGGLSVYGSRKGHGSPFIHIDTRGTDVRW